MYARTEKAVDRGIKKDNLFFFNFIKSLQENTNQHQDDPYFL